jgi:probable HAF family extracellular repeat protein
LPNLTGKQNGFGYGVNDMGQVTGSSGYQGIEPPERATRWTNNSPEDLGTLSTDSQARAINNLGNVAGYSYVNGQPHAFFWSPQGGMVDLIPGDSLVYGYGLNESNQVTGSDNGQAFRWKDGVLERLGMPTGWATSYGYAINASGQVAGFVKNATGSAESFAIYTDGTGWNVIAQPGSPNEFRGINDSGDAVGIGHFTGFQLGYVYLNGLGLYSLTDQVATQDWQIWDAWDINNAGQIVGYGLATDGSGRIGAVRLTPSSSVPTITGFTPARGTVGRTVSVTGTNFTGATAVTFAGTSASLTVVSDTQISTKVPSGALTGPIAVTTPSGTATSASSFGVQPKIQSFTPTSGPVGTTVVITGSAFTGATAVRFNGKAASFTVDSYGQITATVPTGATTGAISVKTPGGTGSSRTNFVVT